MDVCRQYKGLLGAQVDGTATAEERVRLEGHLEQCARCAQAARELARTRQLVTGLPAAKPSPRLMPAISARLRAQRVSPVERLWWRWTSPTWLQPAAVALILVLCIAVTGTAIYHAGPLQQALNRGSQVAQMYGPLAPGGLQAPGDDFVSFAVASHETFERDRAFGDPGGAQNCGYVP
jgi:anti-sigma factor RsiW